MSLFLLVSVCLCIGSVGASPGTRGFVRKINVPGCWEEQGVGIDCTLKTVKSRERA